MRRALAALRRYRILAVTLTISLALHAAIMVGMPKRLDAIDDGATAMYSATLDAAATAELAPPPAPAAQPAAAKPRPVRARPKRAAPPPPPVAEAITEPPVETVADAPTEIAQAQEPPKPEPAPSEPPPAPEKLALAAPAAPAPPTEPEVFPVAALPASVSIQYQLTSAFADGRATYNWERDGDSYRISGEAAAEGFFTLFLEGTIVQQSRGTVTPAGLRPDRFSENRPGSPPEGLEFDWGGHKVTFDRNGNRKTTELADNTVDWLSMIFQLAHAPPHGTSMQLRVFTQRKLYRFELMVLGEEEVEIPLGKVRALHLRHIDKDDPTEIVDVWLGIDQFNLPVKLRYPVARNRLVVEQVATRVTTR